MESRFLNKEYHRSSRFLEGPIETTDGLVTAWSCKEKIKTVAGALVLCLNVGVDPPDFIRISPCPTKQCWIDPISTPIPKAVETIGKKLQAQYERWQPRAKYKPCLDPNVDHVRKVCVSLRKSARGERVLFHYNGHGVPKPTNNGEIWVFNSHYTQYIPLSVYDLHCWLDNPVIYVLDCPSAGTFIESIRQYMSQAAAREAQGTSGSTGRSRAAGNKDLMRGTILMGACRHNENLDTHPEFPADIFTSCLTTPIKVALRFLLKRSLAHDGNLTPELIDSIPGLPHERKSPLGELHWIFTAITDSIAWDVLPSDLFQQLFRQDLLVASLFRNFLLAERVMSSMGVMPITFPRLPATYNHSLWQTWNVVAEKILQQLPDILIHKPPREFRSTAFFSEQLDAFALTLKFGSHRKAPPRQLPVLLQVLLSPIHRVRALELLYEFMELGTWAVELSLSVGVFPYVLKLLQTTAVDLHRTLISIWAKLLALDTSCQIDLCRDGGHQYFIHYLERGQGESDLKAKAAAVLSFICFHNPQGQKMCVDSNLLSVCATLIQEESKEESGPEQELQKWICICIQSACEDRPEALPIVAREGLHDILIALTSSTDSGLRAAAVATLNTFIGSSRAGDENRSFGLTLFGRLSTTISTLVYDGSPIVRCETASLLKRLILDPPDEDSFEGAIGLIQRDAEAQMHGLRRHAVPFTAAEQRMGCVYPETSSGASSHREEIVRWTTHAAAQAQECGSFSDQSEMKSITTDMHRKLLEDLCVLAVDPVDDVSEIALSALQSMHWEMDFWSVGELSRNSAQRDVNKTPLMQGTFSTRGEGSFRIPSRSRPSVESRTLVSGVRSTASGSVEIANLREEAEILQTRIELASRFCQRRPYRLKRADRRISIRRLTSSASQSTTTSSERNAYGMTQEGIQSSDEATHASTSLIFALCRQSLAKSHPKSTKKQTSFVESQLDRGSLREVDIGAEGVRVASDTNLRELTLSRSVLNVDTGAENIGSVLLDATRDLIAVSDREGKVFIHDYGQASFPQISNFGLAEERRTDGHECIDTAALFPLDISCSLDRLMACCTDGSVRVWVRCTEPDASEMLSAFQAVQICPPPNFVLAPACYDWQPSTGTLFSASLTQPGVIRLLDLEHEQLVQQFGVDKNSLAAVDFLKCFRDSPNLLSVGSADGMVRVFDIRIHSFVCGVRAFNSQEPISALSPVMTSRGEDLAVLSYRGGIKRLEIWQSNDSVSSRLVTKTQFKAHSAGCTSALVSHMTQPIMISATLHPVIKVWTPDGEQVSSIRPFKKYKENCQQAVTSMAYHPTDPCRFAAGGKGRICAVYSLIERPEGGGAKQKS